MAGGCGIAAKGPFDSRDVSQKSWKKHQKTTEESTPVKSKLEP